MSYDQEILTDNDSDMFPSFYEDLSDVDFFVFANLTEQEKLRERYASNIDWDNPYNTYSILEYGIEMKCYKINGMKLCFYWKGTDGSVLNPVSFISDWFPLSFYKDPKSHVINGPDQFVVIIEIINSYQN